MSHTYPKDAPAGFEKQEVNRWTCMREHCNREIEVKGDRLCPKCRTQEVGEVN